MTGVENLLFIDQGGITWDRVHLTEALGQGVFNKCPYNTTCCHTNLWYSSCKSWNHIRISTWIRETFKKR